MPQKYYYALVDADSIIHHIQDMPVDEAPYSQQEGYIWMACPASAELGGALVDGKCYPRPEYAVSFDFENTEWIVDAEAMLSQAKKDRVAAIDAHTDELVLKHGLPFGNTSFAMTNAARLNYKDIESGLVNAVEMKNLGIMSEEDFNAFFPVPVLTLTGDTYTFSNPLELQLFFLALATYQNDPGSPLVTGRELKARVNAAATVEEVEAIADDRE